MTRLDDKLTGVKIDSSMNVYKKIQKKNFEQLSTIAQDFVHFIESFGELHSLCNKVSI